MVYFIPDEQLWQQLKEKVKPVQRKVKKDIPKRLRVVRKKELITSSILDLHGLTVQDAFEKTGTFIQRTHHIGLKEITIITGRGTTGKALIKNEFENWLENNNIASHIRAYSWKNRGGAVKINLKKK